MRAIWHEIISTQPSCAERPPWRGMYAECIPVHVIGTCEGVHNHIVGECAFQHNIITIRQRRHSLTVEPRESREALVRERAKPERELNIILIHDVCHISAVVGYFYNFPHGVQGCTAIIPAFLVKLLGAVSGVRVGIALVITTGNCFLATIAK